MNVFEKINELNPSKPYLGFAKLSIGYHQIQNFRFVKNKFGKKNDGSGRSILAELPAQVLFLPQYFCQKLNESDVKELNTSIEKKENVFIHFGGRVGETK